MSATLNGPILVINSGSSSLKAGLFVSRNGQEQATLKAAATGIGQSEGKLSITDETGKSLADDAHDYKTQQEALQKVSESLAAHGDAKPVAIGHRIVHGGMHLTSHQRITPKLLDQLRQAVHFAPLHIPGALSLIEQAGRLYPDVPQFACFDTAFHQTLPEAAYRLPVGDEYARMGVRRYGFHGLSYESIVEQLRAESTAIPDRIVVAHLGSGSSLAAIHQGKSIDTSMSMTPTGGIPMATRTGDLDPGVLIFMMRNGKLSLDDAEELVNHQAGLSALSGGVSDMQKLEEAVSKGNKAAALAVEIFATAVAKTVAAYIVSLNGINLFVFTGGIGEHSSSFRKQVSGKLGALGFTLDDAANNAHTSNLNSQESRVAIRTLPAQEDQQIARHARRLASTPA